MAMLPWWIHYPNVNNEIINLDWILQISNENTDKIENFIGVNTIKYADPILWDITSQYEANTIVVDPQTGDAYISTKAVPYGVHLSNEDYWTKIYNYANAIKTLHEQIAAADEQLSTTATAPRAIGDLVWLDGLLYIVTAPMIAGDSYVLNSNIEKKTIEELLADEKSARISSYRSLSDRIAQEVTDRTDAINDALGRINDLQGDLSQEITDRSNAINGVLGQINDLSGDLSQEITDRTNAINDVLGQLTDTNNELSNVKNATCLRNNSRYLFVGANLQFTTINAAIAHAQTYASANNPVCIFIFEGTYNEQITLLDTHYIDLVGIGKVTIQYAGEYPYSSLYIGGSAIIENIDFLALDPNTTNYTYGVHVEGPEAGEIIFKNCTITSVHGQGLGCGFCEGRTLRFIDCTIVSWYSNASYFHNYGLGDATNQNLYLINCYFNTLADNQNAVVVEDARYRLEHTEATSILYVSAFNCNARIDRVLYQEVTGGSVSFSQPFIPLADKQIILANNSDNNMKGLSVGKLAGYFRVTGHVSSDGYLEVPMMFQLDRYAPTISDVKLNGPTGTDITSSFTISLRDNSIRLQTSNATYQNVYIECKFALTLINN